MLDKYDQDAEAERLSTKHSEEEHERAERQRQHDDEEDGADKTMEAGKKLPPRLSDYFPPQLAGRPLEELDPYYNTKKVGLAYNCNSNTRSFVKCSRTKP